jgi:hypothetical protein
MDAIPVGPWSITSVITGVPSSKPARSCVTSDPLFFVICNCLPVALVICWKESPGDSGSKHKPLGGLKEERESCHLSFGTLGSKFEAVGMKPCDFPPGCKIFNMFFQIHVKWLNGFAWLHELASGKSVIVQDRTVEQRYQCVLAPMATPVSDHTEMIQEAEGKLCP